jgi:hypothetical protein
MVSLDGNTIIAGQKFILLSYLPTEAYVLQQYTASAFVSISGPAAPSLA